MADQPKRRKPWYRLRNILLLILIIIVLVPGWAFWETWRVYIDEPGSDADYRAKILSLCASNQPQGEDGWPALAAVLQRLDDAMVEAARPARRDSDWDAIEEAEHAAVRDLIEHGGVLVDLRAALSKPRFVRPWGSEGMLLNELLPLVSPARTLGEALSERARTAADAGQWDIVIDSMRLGMRLGDVTARQPTAIHFLSGIRIQRGLLAEARYMLRDRDVPAGIAAVIGTIASEHTLPPATNIVEVERLFAADTLEWLHGTRGYALPLVTLLDFDSAPAGLVAIGVIDPVNDERSLLRAAMARWFLATHEENAAIAEQWYDGLIACGREPHAERGGNWPPAEVQAVMGDPHHALLAYCLPAMQRIFDESDALELHRAATRLMAAIEQYEAEHGRFPAALTDLTPAFLPTLPSDPLHGGPFGYRLLADDPHGRAYLLYSYGADGADNGGTEDPEDPDMALLRSETGIDLILNPPRETVEE